MKPFFVFALAALLAATATAQRHKLKAIDAETEEGKILQAIATEEDATRKMKLMEQFIAAHGKHDAAGWVLTQLQPLYVKAGDFGKALEAGDRLVAIDPLDIDAAYGSLKAAEAGKDAAAVLKWSSTAHDIAAKAEKAPKGADDSEEDHKHAIDFAKQVSTYSEYALYATSLVEPDPAKVVQLVEAIEQRNPASQYLAPAMGRYAWAARQANVLPKGIEFGERAFARNQFHEDLLLAMADFYMNQPAGKQDLNKTIQYSTKIIDVLASKPKPEGVSDADWEKKKNTTMGLAHWMAGTSLSTQGKFAPADKNLRVALPLVRENDQLHAGALFHLGLANYQLGKGRNAQQMKEALGFLQQCAAIKSPYQAQAQKNVTVIRKETGSAK